MGTIFISYRRDDSSGYAGRIHDLLAERFGAGRVFRDVSAIPGGVDFPRAIEDAIAAADAVVVVIGRDWLTIRDAAGARRLDDPDDFVRLEIAAALDGGVLVIPVLVEGATMPPPEGLPPSLAPLSRLNALEISDSRWEYDSGRLVERLEAVTGAAAGPREPIEPVGDGAGAPRSPASLLRRLPVAVPLVAVAVLALVAAQLAGGGDGPDLPQPPVDGTQVDLGTGDEVRGAVAERLDKRVGYGSFVFDLHAATYRPNPSGPATVVVDATVENLAMRALAPRPSAAFLMSSGGNYPLTAGNQPQIPAGAKGKATYEFLVETFDFDDATLVLGDGAENQTVVPFAGDAGLVAHLPQPLQLAGTLRAGTFTLELTGGLVTAGPIGTLTDGRSARKESLFLTLYYDFTAAAGGTSSFPNRELSLALPDGTAVTLGDYADPGVQPGNTIKGLFASFVVDDPPGGDYKLVFRNSPEATGELAFSVP